MNKTVFYILLMFSFCSSAQQNLVPNPSFEEYSSCPTEPDISGTNELEKAIGWWKPNEATTDYYNACAPTSSGASVPSNWMGYQQAYHGNAYAGLAIYIPTSLNVSEYIQCELIEPLKPCKTYQFRMYVNLSNFSSHATSSLGVRFDRYPIHKDQPLVYDGFELPNHIYNQTVINDTVNWKLFEGEFIATGGEKYLTIGRFFSDTSIYNNTNIPYLYVGCDSCHFTGDVSHYYIDYISLIEIKKSIQTLNQPNIITPNFDNLNDFWYPNKICFTNWKCDVLNRWGNLVYSFYENDSGWNGKDFKGGNLTEGSYFYKIYNKEQKLTGFIQLVR